MNYCECLNCIIILLGDWKMRTHQMLQVDGEVKVIFFTSSSLADENGPPTGCCALHASFCKAQSLSKSLHLKPHYVHTTQGLIICPAFSSHFKHWVHKTLCKCPMLSRPCPPRSHSLCMQTLVPLWREDSTQTRAGSIYSFYLLGPAENIS